LHQAFLVFEGRFFLSRVWKKLTSFPFFRTRLEETVDKGRGVGPGGRLQDPQPADGDEGGGI
jgi:hypothetical protein